MKLRKFEEFVPELVTAWKIESSSFLRERMTTNQEVTKTLTGEERNQLAHELMIAVPEEVIRAFIDEGINEIKTYPVNRP